MLLEPRVSDVLTTEENRSHYHGKPWKWEGKCLHATPPPFPAHPLISPSRSALRYQGFSPGDKRPLCARGGDRTPCRQPCGELGGEGSSFPPQPRRRARCQIQPGTRSRSLRARCSCQARGTIAPLEMVAEDCGAHHTFWGPAPQPRATHPEANLHLLPYTRGGTEQRGQIHRGAARAAPNPALPSPQQPQGPARSGVQAPP